MCHGGLVSLSRWHGCRLDRNDRRFRAEVTSLSRWYGCRVDRNDRGFRVQVTGSWSEYDNCLIFLSPKNGSDKRKSNTV